MGKDPQAAAREELLQRRLAQRQQEQSPLSFAQERFWFLDQLEPGSSEYHITVLLSLGGVPDRPKLRGALAHMEVMHPVLRTCYPASRGVPFAKLLEPCGESVMTESALAEGESIQQFCRRFHGTTFDLASGPLWRATLLQSGPRDYHLVFCFHHIATDGWSIELLGRDLASYYNTDQTGRLRDARVAKPSYLELALSQRESLVGQRLAEHVDYWVESLAGAPSWIELPFDRALPAMVCSQGEAQQFALSASLSRAAEDVAKAIGATPYQLFLSLFAGFLSRISGRDDLVIGTSYAGRDRPGSGDVAGVFVGTLPLRIPVRSGASLASVFGETKRVLRDAVAHSELPFEKLVSELQLQRDPRRTPLFNVFFELRVHQEIPQLDGLEVREVHVDLGQAPFDLAFTVDPRGDSFGATLQYRTALFDRETIEVLWQSFEHFMVDALADVGAPLDEARLVCDATVLAEIKPQVKAASYVPFTDQFRECARAYGDNQAIAHGDASWSYRRLDRLSNRLAMELLEWVGPQGRKQPIGVCLGRSAEVVLVALGIWKAGLVYVPMDPADPLARRKQILDAVGQGFLVGAQGGEELPVGAKYFNIDSWLAGSPKEHENAPAITAAAEELAYIIFTSGSTGAPKGVEVSHGALANHINWVRDAFRFTEQERFLLRTPLGFDASIWELVHPLVCGACIVVAESDEGRDLHSLLRLAQSARVSVLQTVPLILRNWLVEPEFGELGSLKHLICAGEPLTLDLAQEVLAKLGPKTRLYNLYGPTEACIDSTWEEVDLSTYSGRDSIPIGRPIHGTAAIVLDGNRRPLPTGVAGELYVSGASLARGYLGDVDKTRQQFPELELAGVTTRWYRTGDRARRLHDGRLEALGRDDGQVKIRGHRVELAEIEHVLTSTWNVRQAAVLALSEPGDRAKRLVAFVVMGEGADDVDQLRAVLSSQLPHYMCPDAIVALDFMPLTSSEKTDRRELERLAPNHISTRLGRAAESEVERFLAGGLAKLLGVKSVPVDADFFALGGHSLLATRLLAGARKKYACDLELKDFLARPTIGHLAAAVERAEGKGKQGAAIPAVDRSKPVVLSRAQQRLWLADQGVRTRAQYNMVFGIRLRGVLHRGALGQALLQLVNRHEILRTRFESTDSGPVQIISALPSKCLVELSGMHAPKDLKDAIRAQAQRPFDLGVGPLCRFSLMSFGKADQALVIAMHHILGDGWSLGIFAEELSAIYNSIVLGKDAGLPVLPIQYGDYSAWDRANTIGPESLAAWKGYLAGCQAVDSPLSIPGDKQVLGAGSGRGAILRRGFPTGMLEAIGVASAATGNASVHNILLASFSALIARVTGAWDVVLGVVLANRDHADVQGLIGFFVNALPARMQLGPDDDLHQLIEKTRSAMLFVHGHADVGLDILAESIGEPTKGRREGLPLFRIAFDYSPDEDQLPVMEGLDIEVVEAHGGWAKLDLSVLVCKGTNGHHAEFEYATDLYSESMIEGLFEAWMVLLEGLLAQPRQPVRQISILSKAARARALLLADGGSPAASDSTCLGAILTAAKRAPDSTALVWCDQTLSFGQLIDEAKSVAASMGAQLRESSCGLDVPIAVQLPRSPRQVAVFLGIWWLGRCWLALDANDPLNKRRELIQGAGCLLLVSESEVHADELGLQWVDLDRGELCDSIAPACAPSGLAYVIPTAGTSGAPKWIEIGQRAFGNQCLGVPESFGWSESDVVLHRIPLTFGAGLLELFIPLTQGASVVLCTKQQAGDPRAVIELVQRHRVSILIGVTSWLEVLLGDQQFVNVSSVRQVVCGGERLTQGVLDRVASLSPKPSLINAYGPAETCISVTSHPVQEFHVPIPIGKPMAGCKVYILDEGGEPCLEGVEGEIVVAGVQLAQGYLGAAKEDEQRWSTQSFAARGDGVSEERQRVYWTGDRGMRLHDGTITFRGRKGRELKIGGRRSNLAEVELAIAGHPAVLAVAVVAKGTHSLCAHVELEEHLDATVLVRHCQERLPNGLTPREWRLHDALPRHSSGKTDYAKLSEETGLGRLLTVEVVDPKGDVEGVLVTLFEQHLDIQGLGRDSDYFESGGTSIGAIRLIADVREQLPEQAASIRLVDFFGASSPAQLAELMGNFGPSQGDLESVWEEMERDALLDESFVLGGTTSGAINGAASRQKKTTSPDKASADAVFLTGATGFLGAFLLHKLLSIPGLEVRCLVRAKSKELAHDRIVQNLSQYGLSLPRGYLLKCYQGDLATRNFGLSREAWGELKRGLGSVLHNGAAVDFFHDYRALRPTNVDGAREALRLSFECGAAMNLISTIGVLAKPDGGGGASWPTLLNESTALADIRKQELGYEQTKWVAEAMVAEASRRGLRTQVFRPGRISASAKHSPGAANLGDFANRFTLGCIDLGVAPDIIGEFDLTPVDYAASAIVALSKESNSSGCTWHILHPKPSTYRLFFAAARRTGRHIDFIPAQVWRDQILASGNERLAPMAAMFEGVDDETLQQNLTPDAVLDAVCSLKTFSALGELGIEAPTVGSDYADKAIGFLFTRCGLAEHINEA